MRPATLLPLVSLALAVVAPSTAWSAPTDLGVPTPQTEIYGGTETEQCAWPTVAYLSTNDAACTGTLVHPQIVLTAAHCVPGDVSATVRFGERAATAVQLADTEYCMANPGFFGTGDGTDFGFCKLSQPITNLPIIPIAFGCEEQILDVGTTVTHVGFGVDENGESGRKKFISLQVEDMGGGEIVTGQPGEGICSGDSGGPVFARLSTSLGGDDTWRVVGIHSWAQMSEPEQCNGVAGSTIAWSAVDFIEQNSGIDITPCHDENGDWSPTWACQQFPISPGTGGDGSYNLMCATGPLGDFSQLCGPPLTDFPDHDPPGLDVVSPMGDQVFEVDASDEAELHIEANADDGDGWGIKEVELVIAPEDGDMVSQSLVYPPYRWNTKFPVGGYNLKIIATDNAGNATESPWIAVGVGAAPPDHPPDGSDTSGGGDATGADDGSAGTGDGGNDGGTEGGVDDDGGNDGTSGGTGPGIDRGGEPQGCGCTTTDDAQPFALGLVVLALARRRRARAVATT